MAIEVFNRSEHKYLMDEKTYLEAVKVMDSRMEIDPYNVGHKPYVITNLYYDTPDDYLIRTSLRRPEYKEKLRLRAYGVPESPDAKVYLEIKKKFNGVVNKRRTALRPDEAYLFTRTGIAPAIKDYMNPQVIKEITRFLHRYDLSPKVYVAYDRMAYFEKDDPDLRVSFDSNIRTRRYDLRLEHGDRGAPLLPEGTYLMEIKTAKAKPLWLAHMITWLGLKRTSFSKYGTEYKRYVGAENGVEEKGA